MNEHAISALYQLHLAEEPLTTTELAKRVFDPDGTTELRNADRRIRRYLEETVPWLVDESKREDGAKLFTLDEGAVFFGAGRVQVVTPGGSEVDVGLGGTMVYVSEDGQPEVVSLEREVPDSEDADDEQASL